MTAQLPPRTWPRPRESDTFLESVMLVVRYTRHWVQFGAFTLVTILVIIGAVKGLMAR